MPALEGYENAKEFLAQSEALRQDFPLREAKLRQAADIFADADARATVALDKIDSQKRGLDRATETAAQARAQAREVLAALEVRHADLLDATRAAYGVRSDADLLRQDHQRLGSEIDAARLDLSAFMQEAQDTREEMQRLKESARPFAANVPGSLAAPGAVPGTVSTPPQLYPAGITLLSYVQSILGDGATGIDQRVLKSGDTMTGNLVVDLSASTGPKLTVTPTAQVRSGAFGVVFDKAKALNTNPHSIIWSVGASPTWEIGQDFDTNNADHSGAGNADFITCYDHTANALAGADIMRFSPAEKDTVGSPKSTKMNYGGVGVGTPRTNTHVWTVDAGTGLGGLSLTINSQNARDHLTLVQAFATSKRAVINFGGFWKAGSDIGGVNTAEWVLRDSTNSLNRLYVEQTAAINAKMGLNTTGPVGGFHSATSADPTLYDTVQTGLAVGYSTIANRTWLVQQIIDASQAENFVFMMGGLGAGSTRAVPVATSTSTPAFGIKANQTQMDLVVAPSGTNQTILKGVSVSQTGGVQTVGLYGVTPVIRGASNEDIRTSLINLGAITGGANPLNLNGGALSAGTIAAAGAHQGSGTAFQLARLSFTFTADANQTLNATELANVIIDIQTGVITAQRDLLVSGNVGAFYIIVNRNSFPVNVRVGANTGIVVGATRSRIIVFPGGANAYSLTQDNVYTT